MMNPIRYRPEIPAGVGDSSPGMFQSIVRAWDRFWFTPADPLPLGVIRVFAGLVILYVHLIYSLDLLSLVGPDGWLSNETMSNLRKTVPFWGMPSNWTDGPAVFATGQPIWSVYFHIADPGWIVATHCFFLFVMLLFTIGFATRITSVLTWVGIISYIHRLPVFMYGMDTMMNITAIYLMIGPSGATFSVDRWLQKRRAKRKGLPVPPVQPSVVANFAIRLFQIHFCIIYLASGLSKLQGPAWWNGTAMWGTMANYSFAPMNFPAYVDFLRLLCENRLVWELLMTMGSYFTLFLEISFVFLIWRPKLRWLMICLSVLMHTGIGLIMGLTTFSLFMMCMVLAFVPAATHHAFADAMVRKVMTLREFFRGKAPRTPARQEPVMAGGGV
jgi:hypothetical protein